MSEQEATPDKVATFEGAPVTQIEGRLPPIVLRAMEYGYPRGTVLRLRIDVRVTSVHFDENKDGDLTRKHAFVLEDMGIVSATAPDGTVTQVAQEQPQPQEQELPVQFGRSSDFGDSDAVGF